MSQGNPKPGEIYRHFKNNLYQVICVATQSETKEKLVIYQALYGDFSFYARPYDMFISEVDHNKYPEVKYKYRFSLVLQENKNLSIGKKEVSIDKREVPIDKREVSIDKNEVPIEKKEVSIDKKGVSIDKKEEEQNKSYEYMIKFLDENDLEKKLLILDEMKSFITDGMIDNIAASLDIVIDDGELDQRFMELKYAIHTKAKYESERISRRLR